MSDKINLPQIERDVDCIPKQSKDDCKQEKYTGKEAQTPNIIPEDVEWDYVERTFDDNLEIERKNAIKAIENLSLKEKEILNDVDQKVQLSKKPDFSIQFKIDAEKMDIEVVSDKDRSCDLMRAGVQKPEYAGSPEDQKGELLEPEIEQHPNTIRMYVGSMLAFFSNLRTEFLKDGKLYARKLPVFYGNREKLVSIEQHEFENLFNGNTNFLPRASLVIEGMSYDQNRQQNKNLAVSREINMQSLTAKTPFAFTQGAPSPYNITVRLNIITRGMNDAMMIVEQIAAFFNPHYTFNMIEGGAESQVRLQLDSVSFEPPEMDQFSANEVMTEFSFTLFGNMYKPRNKEPLVQQITMNIDSMRL